jgi:hypothetical protein
VHTATPSTPAPADEGADMVQQQWIAVALRGLRFAPKTVA